MGGLSLWHWLIVLVVVVVIFGTKRLRNVGQDLGEAVKGFKKGMRDDPDDDDARDRGKPAQLQDANRGDQGRATDERPDPARNHDRDRPDAR